MFQMMQARVGTVNVAASQLVAVLASIAYVPGAGIASASATLVGQSIGAGDRQWAKRLGTRAILLTACCTGAIGFSLAVIGPWLLPSFIDGHDAESASVVAVGTRLLWLAAAYQFFDGLNLGSSGCLYGAADITVPATLSLSLSWLIFLPLAHSLTFAPGEGWFNFLPQFGWGVIGGWTAIVVFLILQGGILFMRWHFGAWGKISL
jgi:MATE family multidrug resistance protein